VGAISRLHERRVERRLRRDAPRGVRDATEERSAHEQARVELDESDRSVDLRPAVPPLGLREYWYPTIPSRRVPRRRPMSWQMLGEELVLFRDTTGKVVALTDACPHRGASLSRGHGYYPGTVTCPYHGAVFDGEGTCRAFLTEGPASKMPELLRARSYPTMELRGWVFTWMGDGEPAPPEEDIPPEFFEDENTVLLTTYTYWPMPWLVALENQGDSHNAAYAHLNSMQQLTRDCARPRTPFGPRVREVEGRALVPMRGGKNPYVDETGEVPYQLSYPGLGGAVWPLHRWRQWVWRALRPWYRLVVFSDWRKARSAHPYATADEWADGVGTYCWHLPGIVRINSGIYMYSRFAVPVAPNLSRIVYVHNRRVRTALGRALTRVWFAVYFNWWKNYNFSGQDNRIAAPTRYWTPETLAPTDSMMTAIRRLVVFGSRDCARARRRDASDALDENHEQHQQGRRIAATRT
jgi:phenylpropionate dioxygenase-like ring-hydroxylating dioxygenase large terminal subunit